MGRHELKASINLRSLVRHGRTDKNSESPTFLSGTVGKHLKKTRNEPRKT